MRGKPCLDDRRLLNSIVHALCSGGRRGDGADVYGPKKTFYNRFVRSSQRSIWEGIFSAPAGAGEASDRLFIEAIPQYAELVADKGYGSQELCKWFVERGTEPVNPHRKNINIQYDYNSVIYNPCNVVVRMFCPFKQWRRIATRFDRNIRIFMGRHQPRRRPLVAVVSQDPRL